MNLPQVYMCSPSWTLLPPSSPYHPSGLSQCTSPKHPVSCIEPGLATRFTYDIIHISMPFSLIIPPSPSPTESKRLFYTSVSLLLSRIQGYCYHLKLYPLVCVLAVGKNTYVYWMSEKTEIKPPSCVHTCRPFSRVWLFTTPWTAASQAPLSMGFARQEYCSRLPCPPPGDLPHLGIERTSLASPALAGEFFTTNATWETSLYLDNHENV